MEKAYSYAALIEEVTALAEKYSFVEFSYLTESFMGNAIPLITLGEGEKQIYYIGAHHGAEGITAAVLMKFLNEFCSLCTSGMTVFGMNLDYILKSRTLRVIPMLNPDGVEISLGRVPEDSLWYSRIRAMNGSDDFTLWQANARGVDLNHNYDAGFEEYKKIEPTLGINGGCPTRFSGDSPESEAETGALCNYLRFNEPCALVTLHTQGREIYYTSGDKCPEKSNSVSKYLSYLTGYKRAVPQGAAAYGGLTDYCIQKLGIPAFTLECGKGKNPLPPCDTMPIYLEIRKALFMFPTLF